MEMINDSYVAFNLIEGLFWIALGIALLGFYCRVDLYERRFVLVQGANLFLFGVSDIVEASIGSFFEPGLEWLFVWKALHVILLVVAIPWYVVIRFQHERSEAREKNTLLAETKRPPDVLP